MTIPSAEGATPAMAQWFALKSEHPDALLFFRMGDFYELFFADAQAAASALDIALTHRGTHGGQPIPMCGVPYHAASAYLARLIRRGFRVAVAEQTEAARKPGHTGPKGPLARAIVRVISPGTLTEDELLDAGRHNLLLALATPPGRGARGAARSSQVIGAAWIDISTGVFETATTTPAALHDVLGRLDPAEILAPPDLDLGDYADRRATEMPPSSADKARIRVADAFGAGSLDAFGDFTDEEAIAAAVALDYARRSQAGKMPRLSSPRHQDSGDTLGLDPATRASLDILRARDGGAEHTLFAAVNRTVTGAGARLLAQWLAAPLTDRRRIIARQDGWLWLAGHADAAASVVSTLRRAPD
ncbi:MutS N-terminal domain-containing protein, partial [Ameyamaea chiangmaiensis]|nr:DNA mismatch repair protein MutS [Ameyamaea chiangmaiensis]